MRQQVFAALGLAGLLSLVACHKAVPVAAHPASQTPVAAAAANPNVTPTRTSPPPRAAATPPSEAHPSSGMTPQERVTLNDRLARLGDALFDYNKAAIRTDATTVLRDDVDVIRGILTNYPSQKLIIEGNADDRGSDEYNLALGDKRARAAEEFLTTMGIPQVQLNVISFGKDRPVCTDSTEACWQKNRRVHITAAP